MLNKFIFKKEWHDLIKSRPDHERLDAYDAIFSMAFDTGMINVPSTGIINFLHGAVFKEVSRQMGILQKRRIAGAKGGTQKATNSTLPSLQVGAESASPVESDTLFGVFWDRYALKRDKEGAQRAWKRLKETEQVAAINGIEAYKARCAIEGVARVYPQGYLSHRRWLDDPTPLCSTVHPLSSPSANQQKPHQHENDKNKRRGMEVTAQKPSDFQSTF